MGFEHALLNEPYARQYLKLDAMSRLRSMGSWYADPSRLLLPGEMCIIGSGLGTHALTAVGGDAEWLESVDGGRSAIRVARRQSYYPSAASRADSGPHAAPRVCSPVPLGWSSPARAARRMATSLSRCH